MMDRREVSALLALMAARDGRQIGAVEVEAWHEDLARWDLPTAREAVHRHYTRTRDYARPFDLIRLIREIRAERLDAHGAIEPPADLADDPIAEMAWMRGRREAIAAGLVPPAAGERPALMAEPVHVAEMRRALTDSMRVPDRDGEPETGREEPRRDVDPATAAAMEAERQRQLAELDRLGATP